MVAAPVDYAAKDFVLHLFATFCQAVIQKYGPERSRKDRMIQLFSWLKLVSSIAYSLLWRVIIFGGAVAALWRWQRSIAAHLSIQAGIVKYAAIVVICLGAVDFVRAMVRLVERWDLGREERDGDEQDLIASAKKQLAKVRYLQTRTSGLSGGVNLPGGTQGQLARGISRAEQPLSYPEIVDQFRSFARSVASTVHKRGFRVFIEPFPSWLCLADLQYVDGLGEPPGFPGAAVEFPEDLPGLELGVRALAGRAEFRVRA